METYEIFGLQKINAHRLPKGPILFIILVDDLSNVISFSYKMFAVG